MTRSSERSDAPLQPGRENLGLVRRVLAEKSHRCLALSFYPPGSGEEPGDEADERKKEFERARPYSLPSPSMSSLTPVLARVYDDIRALGFSIRVLNPRHVSYLPPTCPGAEPLGVPLLEVVERRPRVSDAERTR